MKITLSGIFVAVLVLGLALAAYAQNAETYMMKGEVVSIDPEGKTIVIDTAEGKKTVVFQEGVAGFAEVKPGMSVEMSCFDMAGKSCAREVKVISVEQAGRPTRTIEGEVVSIDPEGKTVVIKSPKGEEMTIKVMTPTAEKVTVKPGAEAPGEMMAVETVPVTELKPGTQIKADCFDSQGLFCASRVTVLSPELAGKPVKSVEVVGEVVSIDPEGKTVVVRTAAGEKTLFFQKATTGAPIGELETGKKVRAFCLDIEGKTCIKDIGVVHEPAP